MYHIVHNIHSKYTILNFDIALGKNVCFYHTLLLEIILINKKKIILCHF